MNFILKDYVNCKHLDNLIESCVLFGTDVEINIIGYGQEISRTHPEGLHI